MHHDGEDEPRCWEDVLGRTVVVQLRFRRPADGEIVRRHQYAARALSVDGPALLLETTNGDLASVPAFLGGFVAMEPGEYELPATGETVVDPDWFMPWVVDLTDGASAADAARVTFVPETW